MNGSLKWGLMMLAAALLVAVVMPDGQDVAGVLGIVGLVALLIGLARIRPAPRN